jgi:hypothetical protein
VNPEIQLPVVTIVRRGRTIQQTAEHTISLVADNGTEQSWPDTCKITVVPAAKLKAGFRPRAIRTNLIEDDSTIFVRLILRRTLPADVNMDEPIVFSPGQIVPLDQTAIQVKNNTIIEIIYDMNECAAQLEEGKNEVQITGKLSSGQYFYATQKIRLILPRCRARIWQSLEDSKIYATLLFSRTDANNFDMNEPILFSPGLIEPLSQDAVEEVTPRGAINTTINLTYDVNDCADYLVQGRNIVELIGRLTLGQNFTRSSRLRFTIP